MSKLSEAIKAGRFVVTAELTSPCGPSAEGIKGVASLLKGKVHCVVVEENVDGVHMSSLVAAAHLKSAGVEPVVTMLTRDTNRIGLQSAFLGAFSLGISDVLLLSGHHQALTSEKHARGVYDVDSVQAIRIFRSMSNNGLFACGEKLETPVSVCLGGGANPFTGPLELRALRLEKKVKAGADFIITQAVFDMRRFQEWLAALAERGLPDKVCLIAGIMWFQSADQARRYSEAYQGMTVPQDVIRRLDEAADGEREGLRIALEMIEQLRELSGVRGVHLWARERETLLPELLDAAKLSIE